VPHLAPPPGHAGARVFRRGRDRDGCVPVRSLQFAVRFAVHGSGVRRSGSRFAVAARTSSLAVRACLRSPVSGLRSPVSGLRSPVSGLLPSAGAVPSPCLGPRPPARRLTTK
jgi:hypothetical protein